MAIIRPKKIREMSVKERNEKLTELRLEISKDTASSKVGGTVKSPGRINEIKKTIARILTINNQREVKEVKAGKKPKKR